MVEWLAWLACAVAVEPYVEPCVEVIPCRILPSSFRQTPGKCHSQKLLYASTAKNNGINAAFRRVQVYSAKGGTSAGTVP